MPWYLLTSTDTGRRRAHRHDKVVVDQLLADAGRHCFDVVVVAAFDRVARNVRHFLEVLDELNHLNDLGKWSGRKDLNLRPPGPEL